MDAKVQEKENQLRASMSAELDAEKAALQKQGLSDADIQKKLSDLAAQKNADFNKQLDTFKNQADGDRKKSEATLANLQTQFNADLAKANATGSRCLPIRASVSRISRLNWPRRQRSSHPRRHRRKRS